MYEGDNSLQIPAATELFEHVSQPLNPSIFSTKVLIMQYSESVAAGDELLFEFGELVDLFKAEEAGGEGDASEGEHGDQHGEGEMRSALVQSVEIGEVIAA